MSANRDVLNALAVIFLEVINNLPRFAAIFIDRNTDATTWRCQGTA